MGIASFSCPTIIIAEFKHIRHPKIDNGCINLKIGHMGKMILNCQPTFHHKHHLQFSRIPRLHSRSNIQYIGEGGPEEEEGSVEDLKVPKHWLDPSKASEVSEWLRVTLHKWLDDEYCPEETNVKISEVASHSFYKSLMEKKTDMGEILLEMVQELGSISYQESFHGAFSSANAAVNLIIHRTQQD